MKLDELLEGIEIHAVTADINVSVSSITSDSRQVATNGIFVAIKGIQTDGNNFVDQAIRRGAIAIVSERPSRQEIPWIQVASDRSALALLASNFYGKPSSRMKLVGITGTNGKTTTTHLVESILLSAGHEVALMGTIDCHGPGFEYVAELTTPEAPDLERLLKSAVDAGCSYGVMEVSSHAIALKRVERLDFDVVTFTNLSGDHLDFHGTMRAYFEAKKKLFSGLVGPAPKYAVLNRDDETFEELRTCGIPEVISYGMENSADVHPLNFQLHWQGIDAEFQTPRGKLSIRSRLIGRPNLYNLSAAIAIGNVLDMSDEAIVSGIDRLHSVPGRFEFVDCGQAFRVIVDYAHSDDALKQLLEAAREITDGRLLVVFGCGGERDHTKRLRMGEVAGNLSDFAVVTSDNPRAEDPMKVINMVEVGLLKVTGRWVSHVDREDAIRVAIDMAKEGDTVVLAGKGHESYQWIAQERIPFDDRVVARKLLNELNTRKGS